MLDNKNQDLGRSQSDDQQQDQRTENTGRQQDTGNAMGQQQDQQNTSDHQGSNRSFDEGGETERSSGNTGKGNL